MTTTTATRTANALTVTFPDGTTATTKGKRAASAAALSVGYWTSTDADYAAKIAGWTFSVHATIAAAHKNARAMAAPSVPGGGYWTNADVVVL